MRRLFRKVAIMCISIIEIHAQQEEAIIYLFKFLKKDRTANFHYLSFIYFQLILLRPILCVYLMFMTFDQVLNNIRVLIRL